MLGNDFVAVAVTDTRLCWGLSLWDQRRWWALLAFNSVPRVSLEGLRRGGIRSGLDQGVKRKQDARRNPQLGKVAQVSHYPETRASPGGYLHRT